MEEKAIYVKSDGFIPRTFIELPEDEQFDAFYDNGILKSTDIDGETEKAWTEIFYEVNESVSKADFGYTTCNLEESEVSKEIHKTMHNVGNTVVFAMLNINQKDWLHRITEYLVYMERSIASIPGTVIYWKILKSFFEEDGVIGSKSKQLLEFIFRKNDVIFCHKYMDEVHEFTETFPFKTLGLEKYHIHDIVSLLELYPQGNLNRYISERFPQIPKTLSREKIKELLHTHLETVLSGFKTDELWRNGDTNAIMEFLTECTIQENKITEQELLQPEKAEYSSIIKQWLSLQKNMIHSLNEIQQLKSKFSKKTSSPANNPQKPRHDAKYYALYIRLLEQAGKETPIVRNENDRFPKTKIETFAHNRFPGISKLQYYNHYRDLEDMSNKVKIARSYPDLKEIVAEIAKNDADVLFLLEEFPS